MCGFAHYSQTPELCLLGDIRLEIYALFINPLSYLTIVII